MNRLKNAGCAKRATENNLFRLFSGTLAIRKILQLVAMTEAQQIRDDARVTRMRKIRIAQLNRKVEFVILKVAAVIKFSKADQCRTWQTRGKCGNPEPI